MEIIEEFTAALRTAKSKDAAKLIYKLARIAMFEYCSNTANMPSYEYQSVIEIKIMKGDIQTNIVKHTCKRLDKTFLCMLISIVNYRFVQIYGNKFKLNINTYNDSCNHYIERYKHIKEELRHMLFM